MSKTSKIYINQWNESYLRNDNCILYPKEEVVKFLNRFVRKRIAQDQFIENQDFLSRSSSVAISSTSHQKKALDYGCGVGAATQLLTDFGFDAYGVDISEQAIENAKSIFPEIANSFYLVDGSFIPFEDQFFDIAICESVLDSMHFDLAKILLKELDRVTQHYLFASFISGDNSDYYREYASEIIVDSQHEKGTIQSYFNWEKIKEAIKNTSFKIKWAHLVTEESLINQYRYARYYIVFEK